MGWMSIAQQALVRLIISISLLVSLLGLGSYFLYSAAVEKSARERSDELVFFYTARLQQLEREWELQTQDFKVRVEVSRLLNDPRTALPQMQAFMTVQGTNRRFEHLQIHDPQGQRLFSFGTSIELEAQQPRLHEDGSGSGNGWYRANGDIYRVFSVPVWLGERGNGRMSMFYKIDNALLFNISAPDITLWVSHQGEAVASSAGYGTLASLVETERTASSNELSLRALPWSGNPDDGVTLHIHAPVKMLFTKLELVTAAAVIPLLDGLILWFTLGFWLMRNTRRVTALRGAVMAFSGQQKATPVFTQALADAHGPQEDEISVVAEALDGMAVEAERREQERALEEAQKHLWSQVFASSLDAIVITDGDNRILSVNQAFTQLTGFDAAEVLGQNPHILSSGRESVEFYAAMWRDINLKGQWSGEVEDRRKDGSVYPKWLNISVVRNSEGQIVNFVGVFKDISVQKQNEERFIYLANHDTLTNLPNRPLLLDRLRKALALASRTKHLVALLFLDLDNFKWVNDSLGHASGDKLLITVAERLTATVRSSDTVARLGGDEFVVLLLQPRTNQEIIQIAEKLIEAVAQPADLGGQSFHVTTSIGISVYPHDGGEAATLLKHADTAMYAAKAQGKNQYRFFDQAMNKAATERLELERDLRQAVRNNQFVLYYQPKLCLRTNTICGTEALIRWEHPTRGMVPPDQFIPLAEETALIIEIGEWVLREACHQARIWQDTNARIRSIAVNLSAIQIESDTFVDTAQRILEESGITPRAIEFELTESAVLRSPDRSIATLNRLKGLGFQLALDDFGTGYSSLSYLKRLPVDTLKIDRGFVEGIPHDEDDAQIVRMIVALAKSIHMEIVAEGIENQEQYDFLKDLGCDFLQGYLIARPLSVAHLEQLPIWLKQEACDQLNCCKLQPG